MAEKLDDVSVESLKNRKILLENEVKARRNICARSYIRNVMNDRYDINDYENELKLLKEMELELKYVNEFLEE